MRPDDELGLAVDADPELAARDGADAGRFGVGLEAQRGPGVDHFDAEREAAADLHALVGRQVGLGEGDVCDRKEMGFSALFLSVAQGRGRQVGLGGGGAYCLNDRRLRCGCAQGRSPTLPSLAHLQWVEPGPSR